MTPVLHARAAARRFGGTVDDFLPIHRWFDESKDFFGHFTHRALRHHTQGIREAERIFGAETVCADGRRVPTRLVAEQHLRDDCGRIPTIGDWFARIRPARWMHTAGPRSARETGIARDTRLLAEWRAAVAGGHTLLGYDQWQRDLP